MKYSEIIGVGKHFKSAFDVVSDRGEAWKAFISNERFEYNLSQIITSFTSPSLDKRKSIWIQGTYGTGKSHSLSVIKHLLSDDFETIADYIPKLKRSQLRGSITSFRKNKNGFKLRGEKTVFFPKAGLLSDLSLYERVYGSYGFVRFCSLRICAVKNDRSR